MTEWRAAPDIAEIAKPIIESHHAHLLHYPVRFVYREPARKRNGAECWGTAEIVSGRFAHFVMTDEEKAMEGQEYGPKMFWIEICESAWDTLTDAQRKALIDHELCHCILEETEDGDLRMATVTHDIEEFNAIVERHGLWHDCLWHFGLTISEASVLDV